jgi:hypothetical protein
VQAVAKLADELNRKGSKWDYVIVILHPVPLQKKTLCFIWKTAHIKKIEEHG